MYHTFLDITRDYQNKSTDMSGVIARMCTLFQDNPDVIAAFSNFLPQAYKIEVRCYDSVSISVNQGGNSIHS